MGKGPGPGGDGAARIARKPSSRDRGGPAGPGLASCVYASRGQLEADCGRLCDRARTAACLGRSATRTVCCSKHDSGRARPARPARPQGIEELFGESRRATAPPGAAAAAAGPTGLGPAMLRALLGRLEDSDAAVRRAAGSALVQLARPGDRALVQGVAAR